MRKWTLHNPLLRRGIAVVCAFCTVLAASSYKWVASFRAGSLFILVGTALLYHWALPLLAGRRAAFSLGGGLVFALCQAIGDVMQAAEPMRHIPLLLVGFFPLYTALVCAGLTLLDKQTNKVPVKAEAPPVPGPPGKIKAFFLWLLSGGRKPTLALFGLLVLCWLPFYMLFFPGLATPDTIDQMSMMLSDRGLSAHHPPVHSFWMSLCMRLGQLVFGTYAAGVALASAMQVLLLALLVAAALAYMARLSIGFGWRLAALLLYTLSPVYGWYAVTLWKDVWLAAFSFLFILCGLDITRHRAAFFRSPWRIFLLAFAVFGLIVSKNNGVHIFAITSLVLLVALQGVRRQMAAVLVLGLVVSQLITGPIYSALNIQKGSVREALSIPLLQIALVVRDAPESISPEDRAKITELLPYYDELSWRYDGRISDSVKERFNDTVFRQDLGGYLSLYLRLGIQHPKTYLRAFLEHTYAYYFPDSVFGDLALTPYPTYLREATEAHAAFDPMGGRYAEPHAAAVAWVRGHIGTEHLIPGFALLFNIGAYYWLLLFCGLHACYKKRYGRLLVLVLPLAVWLTCLASPVNGSFRYAYATVLAMPFLTGYLLDNRPES